MDFYLSQKMIFMKHSLTFLENRICAYLLSLSNFPYDMNLTYNASLANYNALLQEVGIKKKINSTEFYGAVKKVEEIGFIKIEKFEKNTVSFSMTDEIREV